mmetsp:Transcript_32645/g.79637  ORF Transcript_32645/g.79637 Transcript_32645/m.79637 type:complete len:252 (+) Transcript_32645:2-757(+)
MAYISGLISFHMCCMLGCIALACCDRSSSEESFVAPASILYRMAGRMISSATSGSISRPPFSSLPTRVGMSGILARKWLPASGMRRERNSWRSCSVWWHCLCSHDVNLTCIVSCVALVCMHPETCCPSTTSSAMPVPLLSSATTRLSAASLRSLSIDWYALTLAAPPLLPLSSAAAKTCSSGQGDSMLALRTSPPAFAISVSCDTAPPCSSSPAILLMSCRSTSSSPKESACRRVRMWTSSPRTSVCGYLT